MDKKHVRGIIGAARSIHSRDPNAFRKVAAEATKRNVPYKWGRFGAKALVRMGVAGTVFGLSQFADVIEGVSIVLAPLIPETEMGGAAAGIGAAWRWGGFLDRHIDNWFDRKSANATRPEPENQRHLPPPDHRR